MHTAFLRRPRASAPPSAPQRPPPAATPCPRRLRRPPRAAAAPPERPAARWGAVQSLAQGQEAHLLLARWRGLSFNSALGFRLGASACPDNASHHLSGGPKGLTTLLAFRSEALSRDAVVPAVPNFGDAVSCGVAMMHNVTIGGLYG